VDEQQKVLPLKEAYRFAADHGLAREMTEIREMEIEWDLSYSSSLRRGYMVDLLKRKELINAFIDQCWPTGKTSWGRHKIEFWLLLKGRYEDFLAGHVKAGPKGEEAEEDQAFDAETALRDFLSTHLESIESGLRLHRDGERSGVEFPVDEGRIDILATDRQRRFVVFELTLAGGSNKVLGQLLYYMGWVDKHLGKGPCRGIIVAKEVSDDLILAAQRVKGVSLYRYKLSFSVERVS
jgi:hypothetical protein